MGVGTLLPQSEEHHELTPSQLLVLSHLNAGQIAAKARSLTPTANSTLLTKKY